jgi:ABC-2 type transport system permease protein
MYPIPPSHLFGIEAMLRATASIEMLLMLIGGSLGALWNPSLPAWAAFATVPFIALNLFLSMGTRDVVLQLLSRRRLREIAALVFVALIAIPQVIFRVRDNALERWLESFVLPAIPDALPAMMPWIATADLMSGAGVLPFLIVVAWCSAAAGFAYWQFRRMLAFDAEAAASAGNRISNRATLMDRLYAIPSLLLPDPLGAMVEKEIRYLARSPRFRLIFLMGCTFGLIVSRTLLRADDGPHWGPGYLTGVSAYSLLLLGEVCVWNSFGFDRSAAQIYFLAPIPFVRVLAAKNITAGFFMALEVALATVVCVILSFPVTAVVVVEAIAVSAVSGLLLMTAGNFLSIRGARGVNSQTAMRSSAPGRTQGLLLLVYPIAFLPAALAYIGRWLFHSNMVFFAVLAAIGAMIAVAYKIGLESAAREAYRKREEMIAALSQGQGPVTT